MEDSIQVEVTGDVDEVPGICTQLNPSLYFLPLLI